MYLRLGFVSPMVALEVEKCQWRDHIVPWPFLFFLTYTFYSLWRWLQIRERERERVAQVVQCTGGGGNCPRYSLLCQLLHLRLEVLWAWIADERRGNIEITAFLDARVESLTCTFYGEGWTICCSSWALYRWQVDGSMSPLENRSSGLF